MVSGTKSRSQLNIGVQTGNKASIAPKSLPELGIQHGIRFSPKVGIVSYRISAPFKAEQ